MTDEAPSGLKDFERHVRAMMDQLIAAHPEVVAQCKPGIFTRRLEDGQVEAYMLARDDGTPMVLGTFPARWLNPPKGR